MSSGFFPMNEPLEKDGAQLALAVQWQWQYRRKLHHSHCDYIRPRHKGNTVTASLLWFHLVVKLSRPKPKSRQNPEWMEIRLALLLSLCRAWWREATPKEMWNVLPNLSSAVAAGGRYLFLSVPLAYCNSKVKSLGGKVSTFLMTTEWTQSVDEGHATWLKDLKW